MDSQFSDDLRELFHKSNFLNTFNNFTFSFDCEEPSYGFHSSYCPDQLFNFLKNYQEELLGNNSVVLAEEDINTSDFKDLFKSIFYFFWKNIVRFQEIYWVKEYEFNMSNEFYFCHSYNELIENIKDQKAFIVVNTGLHNIKFNDEKLLAPNNFCVCLNSSCIHPVNTNEEYSFVFVPLY